jgi:hypothetical protein
VMDLDTGYFYDGYHFNREGAGLYTAYIADMIAREVLPSLNVAKPQIEPKLMNRNSPPDAPYK